MIYKSKDSQHGTVSAQGGDLRMPRFGLGRLDVASTPPPPPLVPSSSCTHSMRAVLHQLKSSGSTLAKDLTINYSFFPDSVLVVH